MELQESKDLIRLYYAQLDKADAEGVANAVAQFAGPEFLCRCSHPFDEMSGAETYANTFWAPFKAAFSPVQRRENIFFAGYNRLDGDKSVWVCSMGHLLGQFHQPWLGIAPSHKMTFLRYCEFLRVENGKIAESSLHIDILGLLIQVGSRVLPEPSGVFTITPGPQTQDGLLFGPQPEEQGQASLDIMERMLNRLIASGVKTLKKDLEADWTPDMLWWGPAGIGASYTHDGYLKGHARRFEEGLEFIRHNGHETRIGEGNYCGFFGYPSLTMKSKGGYLGLTTAGDAEADMRIVDLYRCQDGKLAENWIFIDHLWFLKQLGLDLLDRHIRMNAPAENFV